MSLTKRSGISGRLPIREVTVLSEAYEAVLQQTSSVKTSSVVLEDSLTFKANTLRRGETRNIPVSVLRDLSVMSMSG